MRRLIDFAGILALVTSVFSLLSYFLLSQNKYYAISIQAGFAILFALIFTSSGGVRKLFSEKNKKQASLNFGLSLYSLLFLTLLVLANYAVIKNPLFAYDSTEQKIYTLAPQTKKILASLSAEVEIKAFYIAGAIEKDEKELLDRLRKESSKISWTLLDPEKSPGLVERYKITQPSGTFIFSLKNAETKEMRILGALSEESIVNALLKLTQKTKKTVYYIQGHGEPELASKKETGYFLLAQAIEADGLVLKPLFLLDAGKIPEDASAIILSAPKRDFVAEEKELLANYLKNGGNAIFLAEHSSAEIFNALIEPFGMEVGKNIVVDQVSGLVGSTALGVQPMVTTYGNHAINKDFNQGTLFYTASSVSPTLVGRAKQNVTALAFSSQKSWAESDLALILSEKPIAKFDPEDEKGPISLAAAYSGSLDLPSKENPKPKTSRLVVFGDSDFVNNFNIRELFNRDYFLNSLNWLIGEEKSISIRARTLRESTTGITQDQFSAMFLITVILLPELALIFGLFISWRRKKDE